MILFCLGNQLYAKVQISDLPLKLLKKKKKDRFLNISSGFKFLPQNLYLQRITKSRERDHFGYPQDMSGAQKQPKENVSQPTCLGVLGSS